MVFLHLAKHLAKSGRGTARPSPPAKTGQAIDLRGIGDLGERFCGGAGAGASDCDQQQLVAAAEQVDLLVVGQGARPSISNASAGKMPAPRGDARRSSHTISKKIPSTTARLPPTVATEESPPGSLLVSEWSADA